MTEEKWLPVVGYAGHYEVSNLGRVRSISRMVKTSYGTLAMRAGRILAGSIDSSGAGYVFANLSKDGVAKKFNVHTLVLEAFVSMRPEGMQACHKNGDRTDPRLSNLRWDTVSANAMDKTAHGTMACGERNAKARLTEQQVLEIKTSPVNSVKLSKVLGVASSTIRAIRLGVNWKQS